MIQTAQIQALIRQIEAALSKPVPRLPWAASGAAGQQRQALERTRSYLITLQQQLAGEDFSQQGKIVAPPAMPYPPGQEAESAQQVLQAVLQEVSYLRSNVMQPLRTDLDRLHQEREALVQEIRQLEAQRQQYTLAQTQANQQQILNDFLQSLMARLQDNLSGQMTQMLGNLESQTPQERALRGTSALVPGGMNSSTLTPSTLTPEQRLEQLQAIQAQSDQLLLKLDSTLRVVFESLQSNVQSYQDSLGTGLEKMHALGQRGEAMFAALVNRLAQQLGREASSYLQSSLPSEREANRSLTGAEELPLQPGSSEAISDAQIDRFLNELGATAPTNTPQLSPPLSPDLLNLDWSDSPNPIDRGEGRTLNQTDRPSLEDEDVTVLQVDEEPTQIQLPPPDPSAEIRGTAQVDAPEASYGELDDFYESLFGEASAAPRSELASPIDQTRASAASPLAEPPTRSTDATANGVDLETALFEEPLPEEPFSEDPGSLSEATAWSSTTAPVQPTPAAQEDLSSDLSKQSLEFLFGTEFPSDPEPLEPSLAQAQPQVVQPPAEPPAVLPPRPFDDVEAIGSLADLVIDETDSIAAPAPPASPALESLEPPALERDNLRDESYIPASADEDLLSPLEERAELDLQLDPDMLEQLSADLFSLERLEDEFYPPAIDLSAPEDDDRTLSLDDNPPRSAEEGESATPAANDEWSLTELRPSVQFDAAIFAADVDELFPQSVLPATVPSTSNEPLPTEPVISANDIASDLTSDPTNDATNASTVAAELNDLFAEVDTVRADAADSPHTTSASELALSELTLEDFNVAIPAASPAGESIEPDWFAAPARNDLMDDAIVTGTDVTGTDVTGTDVTGTEATLAEMQPSALEDLSAAAEPNDTILPIELSLDALFSPDELAATPDIPETALTLEDFAQEVIPDQPAQPSSEASTDLFAAAELEDLFTEAETLPFESEEMTLDGLAAYVDTTPSLQEQAILGELFFSESVNAPEALAPEESGLTLGSFADQVNANEVNFSEADAAASAEMPDMLTDGSSTTPDSPDRVAFDADAIANLFATNDSAANEQTVEPESLAQPDRMLEQDLTLEGLTLEDLPQDDLLQDDLLQDNSPTIDEAFADLFTPPAASPASDLEVELILEDLTSPDQPEALPSDPALFPEFSGFGSENLAEETAFTLEGLDLLFEDVSAGNSPPEPLAAAENLADPVPDDRSIEDIFGDLERVFENEIEPQPDPLALDAEAEPEDPDAESDPGQKKKTVADEISDWLGVPSEAEPDAKPDAEPDADAIPSSAYVETEWLDVPEPDVLEPDVLEPDFVISSEILDEELRDAGTLSIPQGLRRNIDRSTDRMSAAPPDIVPPDSTHAKTWYLGIDIGTTGISAVLLNRLTCELHPLYWAEGDEKSFRLPTTVYLAEAEAGAETIAIGSRAVEMAHQQWQQGEGAFSKPLLHHFKPYLRVGVPHYLATAGWEPILQWSEQHTIPLSTLHQALQTLLATLSAQRLPTSAAAQLTCGAVGLDARSFQVALQQLAEVMVGYPVNWSDTYSLNLREAVLSARLVARPEQICFLEDAIASLLSGLRSADGRSIILPNGLSQKSQLHNTDWRGGTLAISAGATVTELTLVNLPDDLARLTYQDFSTRSLAYAGNSIDQDIICQLLHPPRFRQPRRSERQGLLGGASFGDAAVREAEDTGSSAHTEGWNWQAIDSVQATWDILGWADLTLPLPGEPDLLNRHRLQQRLESSSLGQGLLEAAKHLKLILQQQDQFTLELGDQQWQLSRQDLGSRVILPYIQRLNRELNALLVQTGMSIEAINQVVCTGGTASLRAVSRWLRQKLPNATIIQDTYGSMRSMSLQDTLTCSRVAYGLATLPLHPAVLDASRQQYSDYFLLLELLRSFPDSPLSAGSVMQLLERRGINTQVCHLHVLALLEGHLPPGLVPTEKDAYLLAPRSQQNPEYAALLTSPLFQKCDNQTYKIDGEQRHRFQQYIDMLLASTHQTLTEPLTVNLA